MRFVVRGNTFPLKEQFNDYNWWWSDDEKGWVSPPNVEREDIEVAWIFDHEDEGIEVDEIPDDDELYDWMNRD